MRTEPGLGELVDAAHDIGRLAGRDPQAQHGAITALCEFVVAAAAIADTARGTTVNTGLISGGSATNVVAHRATANIDIRVSTRAEQDRIDAELHAIKVSDPRVDVEVSHTWNRPPMTLNAASVPLLALARSVARDQNRALSDAAVGGASDANFVSALGLPVLCGMGAIGGGAHAQGEFIYPDTVPAQTALVTGLLGRLAEPLRS